MEFRADLHCHSTYSDGMYTPNELLLMAKERHLSGLSITDHDTIEAYSDDFFSRAKELEISVMTGVEISCEFRDFNVHVLGYHFDVNSASLLNFLMNLRQKRVSRIKAMLQKLANKKMPISYDELEKFVQGRKGSSFTVIGRPHIAHLMVQKGYVKTFQQAFDLYIKDGGSCYISGEKATPSEAIDQIHLAKGKAIIAHPFLLKNQAIFKTLMEMPFDGMECYYGKLLPNQEKKYLELVKKKKWIATGGSDFHGDMPAYHPLGCSWVNEEVFRLLET